MDLEQSVLERIIPSREEILRITLASERLLGIANEYLENNHIDARFEFVGSFAKGTFLSGTDFDLFMLFPDGTPHDVLVKIGLKAGDDILHGTHMYSEHPYTQGEFEGISVDLVPCVSLDTIDKLQTSVDRTPLHTRFILSRMDDGMKNEVRLLKAFMKGIGTYGAEPYVRGFSGYLCELLVLRYGSFIDVLKACVNWKDKTVLSIDEKGPSINSPLVFYDPVDIRRNVASAVHLDTMYRFIKASMDYLENPSERFFFPLKKDDLGIDEATVIVKAHDSRLITIGFPRPDVIIEDLYSQLWKSLYAVEKKLTTNGFNVLRCVHGVTSEHVFLAFELETDTLSRTYRHQGPPVNVPTAPGFTKKWKGNPLGEPFICDGHWNVIAERPYRDAGSLLVSEAERIGIGKKFDLTNMRVMTHGQALSDTPIDILTGLLHPTFPWEN